mgnify:FL=1
MSDTKNNATLDETELWDAIDALDAMDLEKSLQSLEAQDPMALASAIDRLDNPNTDPSSDDASVRTIASQLTGVLDTKNIDIDYDDPTLIRLKNRAYGLVPHVTATAKSLGFRGWLTTAVAALSLGVAGFSTVAALAPFSASYTEGTANYQLSESSLYGSQSIWNFESIE